MPACSQSVLAVEAKNRKKKRYEKVNVCLTYVPLNAVSEVFDFIFVGTASKMEKKNISLRSRFDPQKFSVLTDSIAELISYGALLRGSLGGGRKRVSFH